MRFTSFELGSSWPKDTWPDYVNVGHEGALGYIKYVQERTCTFSVSYDDDPMPTCSACGYEADADEVVEAPGGQTLYRYDWCVGCGAAVLVE